MAFPLLGLLTGLGSLFGGMSSAKNDAKQQQADTALREYQTAMQGWQGRQGAETIKSGQIASMPTERLKQGALGNLVTGWTPSSVQWGGAGTIPKISGGFSDLKFNDMTKQSADLMQRDALLRQMQGQSAPDITQVAPLPNAPQMPKKSLLDTLLGIGGLVGGVAGAYQDAKGPSMSGGYVPYNPNPEDPWSQNPTIPRPRK